jgi:hypothetical protein
VYWDEGALLCAAALFATCFVPPSYIYVTQIVPPGVVYVISTLAMATIAVLLPRYLKLYSIETLARIPGLVAIRQWLNVFGFLLLVIIGVELVWAYETINQAGLRPLSVEVRNPLVVTSQVLLYVYFLVVLWIGLSYPLLYLLRAQAADPAFYMQGKPLRFGISIALHTAISINILALLIGTIASFALPRWTQGDEVLSVISTWCSPVIIGLTLLTKTSQDILAGMYTWYLCTRLHPLHAHMQVLHPQHTLSFPRPSMIDAARHAEDAQAAIQRIVSEITDARLMLYHHVAPCDPSVRSTSAQKLSHRALRQVAAQESEFIIGSIQGCSGIHCVPASVRSVDCQSLPYYRMLARALARRA